MIAVVASFGVAATAVMSPTTAHAAAPNYCYSGNGNEHCGFNNVKQCERASPGNSPCYRQ